MEDKRTLLKQIGWSDDLIEKCLSGESIADRKISSREYVVNTAIEQDATTLTINVDTPVISNGANLTR